MWSIKMCSVSLFSAVALTSVLEIEPTLFFWTCLPKICRDARSREGRREREWCGGTSPISSYCTPTLKTACHFQVDSTLDVCSSTLPPRLAAAHPAAERMKYSAAGAHRRLRLLPPKRKPGGWRAGEEGSWLPGCLWMALQLGFSSPSVVLLGLGAMGRAMEKPLGATA